MGDHGMFPQTCASWARLRVAWAALMQARREKRDAVRKLWAYRLLSLSMWLDPAVLTWVVNRAQEKANEARKSTP
jgi:hypothetical protein